ncbi:MAG: hypothetical protein ABI426_04065 [Flavobacterium sp.]
MLASVHNIDTGKLIKEYLTEHRISQATLARGVGRGDVSIVGYLMNQSIQTCILIDICYAVKHNFFQDMANKLPSEFTVQHDMISGKDKRIAELEAEIKVLRIENAVLREVRK